MSMKAIDLQFAVHKNDEAGIRQNQMMQKPRLDEALLENQASQTVERDRHRSSKLEESAKSNIHDQAHQGQGRGQEPVSSNAKEKQSSDAAGSASSTCFDHPYKGHHIDVTL
ncbi:hypothetical protein [Paenibacillus hexagrammi]|uniref:Uncharacterized protein n=1 Tax=Paenibacillus hexagrammi TaxID=2908839 RepID=A0ABY3SMZ3_9BACL|nr:hypothetical protein [Paenibacillus sp. YPD9-1]UJF35369.1 hypothetical protein L0M14_09810 [Paenibacillus sp. YPD9-1]